MPVEEGRQVPAAVQDGHLVRVDVGHSASPPRRTSRPAPARWPTAAAVTRGRHRNGSPRAAVSRSAAMAAPIGPRSAARTTSGSAASTTARDHNPGPASAGGTRPEPTAHRQAARGTRSRPAAWFSS
ncbi:hypothetical protein EF912_18135 [Streptomyces sp. WAC07061]|uniref:hypothetical protein n=1 Tax=Streptomyces sp. WAC07061 TaxID=2487410 RepID=UPI000F7ABC42|nr:hypothetical protein [Streptomyces sp. WAC07061]RSS53546.1 hypothetical protein EF912_18135 [Streptomyces sp. WAC07061]